MRPRRGPASQPLGGGAGGSAARSRVQCRPQPKLQPSRARHVLPGSELLALEGDNLFFAWGSPSKGHWILERARRAQGPGGLLPEEPPGSCHWLVHEQLWPCPVRLLVSGKKQGLLAIPNDKACSWPHSRDATDVADRALGHRETWIRILTLPLTSIVNFRKIT